MRLRLLILSLLALALDAGNAHAAKLRAKIDPFQAIVAASRTSGVAPLAVMFDATSTTYAAATAYPFHEIEYTWTFGDASVSAAAGTCGQPVVAGEAYWRCGAGLGGNSKNAAKGPVAAHVFETPGTYTVALTAKYGSVTRTKTLSIVVGDPATTYAGTNTVCVAAASTPVAGSDGCPAGAAVANQSVFNTALSTYLATGKRVLLKHDDTWSESGAVNITLAGPWTLGMYGTGAKPRINYASGTSSLALGTSGAGTKSDMRIMDLQIDGNGAAGTASVYAVDARGPVSDLLVLRVDTANIGGGFGVQGSTLATGDAIHDKVFVVDSTFKTSTASSGINGAFWSASRAAWLGLYIDNAYGAEFNFRSMYWNKMVVSNGTFARPLAAKGNITLRGVNAAGVPSGSGTILPGLTWSEYGVVSDNELIGGPGATYALATAPDDTNEARNRNLIVERNWWHAQDGTAIAANIHSQLTTLCNNIMDLSASSGNGLLCISSTIRTGQFTNDYLWVYNNSCYSSKALTSTTRLLDIQDPSDHVTAANNVLYTPNWASGTYNVIVNGSTGTVVGANGTYGNSTVAQAKGTGGVGPQWAGLPSSMTSPAAYKPAGGYTVGGGIAIPVWADFFGVATPTPADTGAVVH